MKLKEYLQEIFYVLSGTLVIFYLLETVWPNLILAYLNVNWVLILWLFTGIVILVINNKLLKDG